MKIEIYDKIVLGIWIVMNLLYVVTWIVTGIRYLRNRSFERYGFEALDIVMAALWTIILIVAAGIMVGKYL